MTDLLTPLSCAWCGKPNARWLSSIGNRDVWQIGGRDWCDRWCYANHSTNQPRPKR